MISGGKSPSYIKRNLVTIPENAQKNHVMESTLSYVVTVLFNSRVFFWIRLNFIKFYEILRYSSKTPHGDCFSHKRRRTLPVLQNMQKIYTHGDLAPTYIYIKTEFRLNYNKNRKVIFDISIEYESKFKSRFIINLWKS